MPASHTVFISYSHANTTIIERFKQDLHHHDIEVWIDHESLTPGELSWEEAIRRGIRVADVVLYMASPEARLSRFVQGELDVAERESKLIIPIWVAGEHWVDVVPMIMSKMQHIDARTNYPVALQQLLKSLGNIDPVPNAIVSTSIPKTKFANSPTYQTLAASPSHVPIYIRILIWLSLTAGFANMILTAGFIAYPPLEYYSYPGYYQGYIAQRGQVGLVYGTFMAIAFALAIIPMIWCSRQARSMGLGRLSIGMVISTFLLNLVFFPALPQLFFTQPDKTPPYGYILRTAAISLCIGIVGIISTIFATTTGSRYYDISAIGVTTYRYSDAVNIAENVFFTYEFISLLYGILLTVIILRKAWIENTLDEGIRVTIATIVLAPLMLSSLPIIIYALRNIRQSREALTQR